MKIVRKEKKYKEPHFISNELIIKTHNESGDSEIPHYLDLKEEVSNLEETRRFTSEKQVKEPWDDIFRFSGIESYIPSRIYIPAGSVDYLSQRKNSKEKKRIDSDYSEAQKASGFHRTYRITLDHEVEDLKMLCDQLKEVQDIEDAYPNYLSENLDIFSDHSTENPAFEEEFTFPMAASFPARHLTASLESLLPWGLRAIDAESAWKLESGSPNVVVAVIDSGVDQNHPLLAGRLLEGYDFVNYPEIMKNQFHGDCSSPDANPFDEDGHGTHCAGIIAAGRNDEEIVAGVCQDIRILPLRAMCRISLPDPDTGGVLEDTTGSYADIKCAIAYAVESGAQVINMSFAFYENFLQADLQFAADANICLIAGTGEDGTELAIYPAADDNVLAVGAVVEDEGNYPPLDFSNFGDPFGQFVMAPGHRIKSTAPGNTYQSRTGTSMATAFVSGVAGLLICAAQRREVELSNGSVYDLLRRSTIFPNGISIDNPRYGVGLVNARNALELLEDLF